MSKLRLCSPEQLPDLIEAALAEEVWLAPVTIPTRSRSDEALAWLRPDLDETSAPGGVIVTTSGSTGEPKGVCLSGRALVAGARATEQVLGPGAWVGSLPLHYVAGLMTLVRATVAERPFLRVTADLADLPTPTGDTFISVVATQLHRALPRDDQTAALRAHTAVLVGGSAPGDRLLEQARDAGLRVITTYGMSETAGGCVYDGTPLPGVEVHLADDQRITISGPMLFSGYRLRPDLTAATLVDGRVVTADRGTLVDGRLSVLGRIDDVVISGGVNVDLTRVQAVLDRLVPERGAAIAVPDAEWGALICAVIAGPPAPTSEPTTIGERGDATLVRLRERLRDEGLEPAALPKRLALVDELPRTISGKIDRQRLAQLFE